MQMCLQCKEHIIDGFLDLDLNNLQHAGRAGCFTSAFITHHEH